MLFVLISLFGAAAGLALSAAVARLLRRIEGKAAVPFFAGLRSGPKWNLSIVAVTIAATLLIHHRFGFSSAAVAALLLSYTIVVLSFVDIRTFLLPDLLTLPLIVIGLAVNIPGMFVPPGDALIGAAAGYLVPWLINAAFRLLRKKDGMGGGDFKLLAALGAWAGWMQLPLILFLASLIGLAFALAMRAGKKPFPFGPSLGIAGVACLCYSTELLAWYTGMFH